MLIGMRYVHTHKYIYHSYVNNVLIYIKKIHIIKCICSTPITPIPRFSLITRVQLRVLHGFRGHLGRGMMNMFYYGGDKISDSSFLQILRETKNFPTSNICFRQRITHASCTCKSAYIELTVILTLCTSGRFSKDAK